MKLSLHRERSNNETTIGKLYVNGVFECSTLEDEYRKEKVAGETRIPEGNYEIKKRVVLSGLTQKYRKRFDWFDFHLMLQDVPNFNYVYIHVGNNHKHTDGCILVGQDSGGWEVWNSVDTFKPLYQKISNALYKGEKVTIDIK